MNIKCLYDFYTFQHTLPKYFYIISIFEFYLLVWFGYKLKRDERKRPHLLKILTILFIFVIPPIEVFLTCYPISVAYGKSIMLVILMWIGVEIWTISQKKYGMKQLKQ